MPPQLWQVEPHVPALQTHWLLLVQVLLVPHCEGVVHSTHCPPEQYGGLVPPQSLDVQQESVEIHLSLAAQYFCPATEHLPAHAAACAMQPPSQS